MIKYDFNNGEIYMIRLAAFSVCLEDMFLNNTSQIDWIIKT